MKRMILASSSPRRIEILRDLGLDVEVIPSNFKEDLAFTDPKKLVEYLAFGKAQDVALRVKDESIIIAADTIVVFNDRILGKPSSYEDAFDMLKLLSGNIHEVLTGICIIDSKNGKKIIDYEKTTVYFNELNDDEIRAYIESKEPMDKAGAYGIQGLGRLFVKKIDGCYYNVMGLPVSKLYNLLKGMGINIIKKEV